MEQDAHPVLTVRHLQTQLRLGAKRVSVVDDLSFELKRGRTLALVGESGCGKSMTALSLLRILPKPPALDPTGEVIYQERNLLTLPESQLRKVRGSRLAMIFQDPMSALNPVYPIGNQLLEVVDLHMKIRGPEALDRVCHALHEVGIPAPKTRLAEYPHQLSGGMKQRVMIAMAMLCEPDVLIADEPTTALDVTVQAQVLGLMRRLMERKGTALLLITHDMGVVAEMADEVIVMYAAKAVERGPVDVIFDHPAHPYTRGLFRSRPGRGELVPIGGQVPNPADFPKGCRFHPRCSQAMEVCSQQMPPTVKVGEKQESQCWLHE